MSVKSIYRYLALFFIHVVIALVAFQHFWMHPNGVLFSEIGDGLKNVFTLVSYVNEPVSKDGIFKYNTFQYPFGDYVYYTDNTPLFSVPFRFICHHVYDLSAYTVQVLYSIVILNIILSGLLIYYILKRITGEQTISFIMAIVLPWANMQVLRIWAGHDAFSFTSLILLAIILMMQWHRHILMRRKQAYIGIAMCLLAFFSFLAQGYYLAIITGFLSGMLFFHGIYYRKQPAGKFSIAAAFVVAIIAVCLTMSVLGLTDGYLSLRPTNATGYDWMEQKVRFTSLFSHYNFQQLYFPVSRGVSSTEAENAAYLGNIGLYALLVLGLLVAVSRSFRSFMINEQRRFFTDPLKGAVFLGGVLLFFISFGEHYYTEFPHDKGLHIVNILNPFLYLHQLTRQVEQFRSLERFIWPFFFTFNCWIAYTIAAVCREYGTRVKAGIIVAMLFLGGGEMLDFVREMRYKTQFRNVFSTEEINRVIPKHINFTNYQAILPIPYYSMGAENYDYIICDNDWWSNLTYRLALKSGLPLMASKMSRTPIEYNLILFNFVAYDSLDARLKVKLTQKPVLVAVSRKLLTDYTGTNIPREGSAEKIYKASLQFASRNHLQAVDSLDDVIYYEWHPPAGK